MSLDAFLQKINTLVAEGCFADMDVPQVRVEGTTAWGVWLRINSRQATFARRPHLLCGVLFHVANRTLTFHGDVSEAARLLPIFRPWTSDTAESTLTGLQETTLATVPLDDVSRTDPDAVSSAGEQEPGADQCNTGPSSHVQAIQELQSQVLSLTTMLNNMMRLLGELLPAGNLDTCTGHLPPVPTPPSAANPGINTPNLHSCVPTPSRSTRCIPC